MFSLRTTWGTISIILVDAAFCHLILSLYPWYIPGSQEWLTPSDFYTHLMSSAFALTIIICSAFFRFYSFMSFTSPVDLVNRIIPALLVSFAFFTALSFILRDLLPLNWRLIPALLAIFGFLFLFRFIIFFCLHKNRERLLVLGTADPAQEFITGAAETKYRGYEIVGVVTDWENRVGTDFHGVPVLSLFKRLEKTVQEHTIDTIVVTIRQRRGKLPTHDLLNFKMKNKRIMEGFAFYEKVKRKIFIDDFLKPSWFIFEEGFFCTSLHGSIKRTQGIIVSLILLSIFMPVLLLVAILIKLDSPGPVFYRQERIGRSNKIFRLLKFRSMSHQKDTLLTEQTYTQKNDLRITRVGKIIRKMRIDEVPQFINIFKGDMDLVGPRPEQPRFVSHLKEIVPFYDLRHTIRPGLTGWAQVNYAYGDSDKDAKEKLRYDLFYLKHFSWSMDLLIIILTIKEVLFGKGR